MAGSITHIQSLLNEEAKLSNKGMDKEHPFRKIILAEIRQLRGTEAPVCFGEDDCSTLILSQCPFRMDCGS
jgi:hypothetical protein